MKGSSGAIRNLGSSLDLVACAGGNLSEERLSPRPLSKDFSAAVPAEAGTAVAAKKFLKGGRLSEKALGKLFSYAFSVRAQLGRRQKR